MAVDHTLAFEGLLAQARQRINRDTLDSMMTSTGELDKLFPGARPFSSAQYGSDFIVGTIRILDVFDARHTINQKAFEKYAATRPPRVGALSAASLFLKEFGYDTVLYPPDEFHPHF